MRFAVIVAIVALHAVVDLRQLHDGHAGGARDGFAILLLQLEPDGVRTRFGEAGQSSAVRAVLGGRVGHAHALGGNVQRDGVRFAVVIAGVVADHVLDLAQLHDGERMKHIRVAVGTRADDFDAIAAQFAGRSAQRCAIGIAVVDLPRLNAFVEGRKLHGFSVIGKAARQGGFHRLAHVRPLDGNGLDAGFCFVKLLFDLIGDRIIACTGEFGVLAAVLAIYGIGVAHACALRRGDAHRNRMRRAVVIAVVAAGAVYDFTCDLGSVFQRIAVSRRIAASKQISAQRTAVFGQHGHGHHGRQQAQNQYHRANSHECSSHGWFLLNIVLNRRSYGKA